jgi:hypothetical protein
MFKDTVITAKNKKREAIILLACFLLAYLLNVIGIIAHQTQAKELLTQIPYVLLLSLIFYGFILVLRILYYLVARLWTRKR